MTMRKMLATIKWIPIFCLFINPLQAQIESDTSTIDTTVIEEPKDNVEINLPEDTVEIDLPSLQPPAPLSHLSDEEESPTNEVNPDPKPNENGINIQPNRPNLDYFFSEDFVLGDYAYIVNAAEYMSSGIVRYKISIEYNELTASFDLSSIQPDQRSIAGFIAKFKASLSELETPFDELLKSYEGEFISLMQELAENPKLQPEEKQTIEQFTNKAANNSNFNSRVFEKSLEPVVNALAQAEEDKKWLEDQIAFTKRLSQTNKSRLEEALDNFANSFLMNAYLASIRADSDAQATGVIYAQEKAEIFLHQSQKFGKRRAFGLRNQFMEILQNRYAYTPADAKKLADEFKKKDMGILQDFFNFLDNKDLVMGMIAPKSLPNRSFKEDPLNETEKNKLREKIFEVLSRVRSVYETLKIIDVSIEFESDQIKNIKVKGEFKRHRGALNYNSLYEAYADKDPKRLSKAFKKVKDTIIFQNRVPISYSTKRDISRDYISPENEIKLFANQLDFGRSLYIRLSDVFINDYRLLNGTENYSPTNSIITVKPRQKGKVVYKEKTVNILQAKIFSDFVGFDASQPNGLIQTEVSKRVFLNSNIRQFGKAYAYRGWVNSVAPKVALSKLEENNRNLLLDTIPGLPDDSLRYYVSTIDFFRHTNFSVGGEVNLVYFGLPKLHTMIYLNAGIFMGKTSVAFPIQVDSLGNTAITPEDFSVTSINVYPEIAISVNPHPSYRFAYSFKYSPKYRILSRDFEQVNSPFNLFDKGKDVRDHLLNLKFTAAVKPKKDSPGELFFRAFFTFVPQDWNMNYLQAQVGYSFNLFSN